LRQNLRLLTVSVELHLNPPNDIKQGGLYALRVAEAL
jgi:hypothetical protein